MFDIYKPSGSFGALTLPFFLVGIVLAVLFAYVYQFLLEWLPLIYVCFLLTIGLGTLLGMLAAFFVKKGHCRNVAVAGVLGIVMATTVLGAKYLFQYPTWVNTKTTFVLDSRQLPETDRASVKEEIYQQVSFIDHLQARTEEGWLIGRGGLPLTGIFVYLVWLIEAGIVYYFAWTLPTAAAREPYSEKMSQWAEESQVVMTLPVTDSEMVSKIQSASSVDELLEIPIPKTDQSTQFAVYTVDSIPGQELEDAYLSVTSIAYSINKKGEQVTKEVPLVRHAILSSEKRIQLIENAELLLEAMADYRASKLSDDADEDSDEDSTAFPS